MAREEKQPSGAGGKFRKAPFRRTTPYDRPSSAAAAAALRNPRAENGGWISKLVDPAQRLISYSAHRFFNTVFKKRLAPPPPPPPQPPSSSDANHEEGNIEQEEVRMDPSGVQNVTSDQNANPSTNPDGEGFTVLEQILEQKTFTRPEIDRLKALLHSRTVDATHENQEERSKALVSYNRNEELSRAPLQDKRGIKSHVISTPVVSTRVLDEDVASPAELAKAYMGSRPSKVSPSMLGMRGQALFEDSQIKSSVPFPSKSPVMSVLPKTSGNGGPSENGFATPRSRGRSAIYSMARTPYSRVPTSSTYKGVASTADAHSGPPSSSRSLWEQTQSSGSKQGALKRRFSVLDNDIGSVGPIRRTRPKSSLLSSRGLSSPVSSSTVFMNGIRISSESAQNPQSSIMKPLALGEPKHTMTKTLSENGDTAVPSTSFSTVPSKSSEAASKIFEHLDKLVSPKEKSPTKLSPSMLRGQALKSMEDVDSSNYLESGYNNNNSEVSINLLEVHATSQKEHKVKEKGPSRSAAPCDGSTTLSVVESTTEKKDAVLNVKDEVFSASDTVARPSEKKRPFKMSAHEYLELDDDDFSNNGVACGSFSDGRLKVEKIAAVAPEKPPAISEVKPPPSVAINQKADLGTFDSVHTIAARATDSIPKLVGSDKYKNNSDDEFLVTAPETAVLTTSSSAMSIFSNATPAFNNLASQKVSGSTAFSANTNSGNNVVATSAVTNSSSNLQSSVSAQSSAEPIFKFGSTTASTVVTEVPVHSSLESLGNKKKDEGFSSPSSSRSFGGTSATGASTGSGFLGSITASTLLSTGSGSGPSAQTLLEPSFKFEASTSSTAAAPTNISVGSSKDKSKQGEMLGIPSGTSFFSTSATSGSAPPFGFSAAASTPSQSLGSTLFSGGSGSGTSAQSAPVLFSAGTGSTSFTQSAPVQKSSSASIPVFMFAGNTAFSSGNSALGSSPSSEANPVSSSTAPSTGGQPATSTSKFSLGFNSTSLSPGFEFSASSASGATDSTVPFGASSASAATNNISPISFRASTVSAPSSNSASLFGASSTSAATTDSLPNPFGTSTVSASSSNGASVFGLSNGGSSTGIFQFGSSATNTASSKPAFGNSSTIFPLSAAPSGNNDHMSMEDSSMAEDTVPAFSQQPVSTPQSGPTGPVFSQAASTPQSPFVFGGSTGYQFPSQPNPSNMQNPLSFQASAPQNPLLFQASNPQDPSPFQASSSLGTTPGISLTEPFSLGSTGGDKSKRRMVKVKHKARKQ